MSPDSHTPCPVCGGTNRTLRFEVKTWKIYDCACGHGYVSPMPTPAELDIIYSEQPVGVDNLLGNGLAQHVADYLDKEPSRYLDYFAGRMQPMRQLNTPKNARILDFGSSMGAYVNAMKLAGYSNVCGYDIAKNLTEAGAARWKIEMHSGNEDDFLSKREGEFDLITSSLVFEHLPDPKKSMQKLSRALKPGGALVLSVPNAASIQVSVSGAKSPIVDPPYHVQYFSPKSITKLFNDGGFNVASISTPFWYQEADMYLNQKGYPMWFCKLLRWSMFAPRWVIQGLKWGGVIFAAGVKGKG